VDSINVAQNREDLAVVNTIMNLLYPYNSSICGLAEDPVNSLILFCLTDEWCVRLKHIYEHMPRP
jgi:hypothetical protein